MIKIQREPTLLVTTNSQDSILAKSIEAGCYEKSRMTSIEEYWDTNIVPAELCKSYHSIPSSNPLPVPETTEENEVMKSINALIKGKDEESKSHEDKESKEFEAGEEEEDKEEEDKEEEDKEDKEESKKSLSDVLDDLVKSGEGSRGGKIIGHTSSGKPIYENHNHPDHANFDSNDHKDAADAHLNKWKKVKKIMHAKAAEFHDNKSLERSTKSFGDESLPNEEQIKKGELSFDPVIDDQGVPSNVGDAKFVHDDADLVCLRELVGSGIVPIDDPVIKPILSRVGVIY